MTLKAFLRPDLRQLSKILAGLCTGALLCVAQSVPNSAQPGPAPQSRTRKDPAVYPGNGSKTIPKAAPLSRSLTLADPGRVRLSELPAAELSKLGSQGGKRRIGLHREVAASAMAAGTWTSLPSGQRVWRLQIGSPSAAGVRIHFSEFSVGAGRLWLYGTDPASEFDGPYTAAGPYGNGDFWSATVAGESVVIEYAPTLGAGDGSAPVPFRVRQIAHQAVNVDLENQAAEVQAAEVRSARFSILPASTVTPPTVAGFITRAVDPAASCNLDVNCYPAWQDTKRAVANIMFEETQGPETGTFLCSGSLVGTRDNSFKPYLLTAGHCIHDEAAARSLQTWWAYESPACNAGPPATKGTLKSSNGGNLLAWSTIEKGDYSLVLLPDVPTGVVFAGWDPSDLAVGTPVVGIHHPTGSYKRISFGNIITSADVNVAGDIAPAPLFTDVGWSLGITQPGSSGSPLFSGPAVVVGMLTYGPDVPGEVACTGGDYAGYGKFSNAYPKLSSYLEDLPYSQVTPSVSSLQFTGLDRQITGKTNQAVTLTVGSTAAVPYFVRADDPWVQVSTDSGTVSSSTPVRIQVTLDPQYFATADTYTSTLTVLSGAAPPQFVNVTMTMKFDASNITVTATPNPVPNSAGTWNLNLHLADSGGAQSQLTGMRIDGADYSASINGFFGGNTIAANGSIDGSIYTRGLNAPVQKFFEFFGQDTASGVTWYRTLTVSFLP